MSELKKRQPTHDNSIVIDVSGVWKRFRLAHERTSSLKELFLKRKGTRYEEFWALRDISFRVRKGETLGIIGENGSGKSTMLKLLTQILRADRGQIRIQGRVSALLELGAGFHPELTGRENIYLNGSILGLSRKEIDQRFNEIVSFAELEKFIDTPVKNYSSGMYVRLGFAIAINVNPDILLIDEVLAVGDESFQQKCFQYIDDFQKKGKTILFITHELSAAQRICDSLILLKEGVIKDRGNPREIIGEYYDYMLPAAKGEEKGNKDIIITKVGLLGEDGKEKDTFNTGESMEIQVEFEAKKPVEKPVFGIGIYDQRGFECFITNTQLKNIDTGTLEGKGTTKFSLEHLPMLQGKFSLTVGIQSSDGKKIYHWQERMHNFTVKSKNVDKGLFYIPSSVTLSLGKNKISPGPKKTMKHYTK